jgi:hypothetical protein
MKEALILKIESVSKSEKYIIFQNESGEEKITVKKDIVADIKNLLEEKNLKLQDFSDFIAIPTESFTGYREAVNIVNTLKHFVSGTPIENLEFPKYHKDPNVNFKSK